MSQTTTPSGAEAYPLALLDVQIRNAEERGHIIRSDELQLTRKAVAALIARNAEMEAERDAHREWRRDVCERLGLDCAQGAEWAAEDIWGVLLKEVERADALAAENKALREDAERYRWLRDVSVPPHNFYISVPVEFTDVRYTPAEVDKAIDEAIAALSRTPAAAKGNDA